MILGERLLQAALEAGGLDDALVREVAASPDAQGTATRLLAVFANLPGEGARAAEARLDQLLDAVALVAAGELARQPVSES